MLETTLRNVRCGRNHESSEQNWLSAEDVRSMVQLCRSALKPMGHGHLSCIAPQSGQCY